ncbi:MATE family efflux transporter [Romboutsia ilealis]|uniref:MATE family efflux transporter n=1 Tax=Romboutsia faecis TaxID=2764597 RepID=A0ABR7JNV4_9FIRM|nr:MATE family efflux transporter [Romboutsia faecis]MBC5996602.1 MATE family efflux transporter [Romboutsia faecis]MRN24127.1 MATE family efflux transporter [Romboutsia ilealis]
MQLIVKDKNFYKKILQIGVPISLQGLITFSVNMTDTMMLGSLGEVILSASSLANQFCLIFLIINYGLGGGSGVLTGQFWGQKDTDSINKTLSILLRFSLIFAVLLMLAAQIMPEKIMGVYTTEADVIKQGAMYLKIISLSFIMQGIVATSTIVLRTIGTVNVGLIASGCSFLVNIILNYMLIFGKFGAPELGIQGAAIGTLVARIIEFTIIVYHLLKSDKKIQFKLKYLFSTDQVILKKYIKIGFPVLVSDIILVLGMNMLSVIMGRMGSEMVAGNSISNIVNQFTMIFLQGVSSASSVIIGNTIGEGNIEKAQERGITFLVLSLILGIVSAIIILLSKNVIVDFYNVSDSTKQIAYALLNSTAFIAVFSFTSGILTKGVLRAGGDTKFLMIADVLFLWAASIPLGYVAGIVFNLPPGIVFIALKIDEIIKSLWCIKRLSGKKWIRRISNEELKLEAV